MITEARDIYLYLLYLVGGIYQSGDLKLKSVKISVQGPFKAPVGGAVTGAVTTQKGL